MFNKHPLQNTSTVNWKWVLKQLPCTVCAIDWIRLQLVHKHFKHAVQLQMSSN